MTKMYCTPAEMRTQIEKTGVTGSASDEALQTIIEAVSQSIDRYCNRPDGFIAGTVATARLYSGSGTSVLRIDDCIEVDLVAVKDSPSDSTYTSWASTDWIAFSGDAKRPDFNGLPYTALMVDPNGDYATFTSGEYTSIGVPTCQVTSNWGFSESVPPVIKQATIAIVSRWFKRGQSSWSELAASPELGNLVYTDPGLKDIRFMLDQRFTRPAIG